MIRQKNRDIRIMASRLLSCVLAVSSCSVMASTEPASPIMVEDAGRAYTAEGHNPPLANRERRNNATAGMLELSLKSGKLQAAEAAFSLALMAIERGDMASASYFIEEAVSLHSSHYGYLQVAAHVAFNRGEFSKAELYQVKSLSLAREMLGSGDIRTVVLMDDLGQIYFTQERYEDADKTWRASLHLREQILGENHPSVVPRLTVLARLSNRNEKDGETERLLRRSIHILQSDVEADPSALAVARHVLADFYLVEGRTDDANTLYQEVKEDLRAASSEQRMDIAVRIYDLGNWYLSQLKLDEARAQFELVVELLEPEVGNDNRYVAGARAALEKLAQTDGSSGFAGVQEDGREGLRYRVAPDKVM